MHNHTFVKNVLLNNEIKTFTKQRRSKIDENPVAPSDKRYLKGRKKVIDLHSSFSHDFYLVVFHIFLIKERTSVLYIYRIIGERLQFAFRYFVSKNINLEELALTERERERERERENDDYQEFSFGNIVDRLDWNVIFVSINKILDQGSEDV